MEAHEFDPILIAVRRADGRQWEIGDALIEVLGPAPPDGVRDGSQERLRNAAAYLSDEGFDRYSDKYLANLRTVSSSFNVSDRKPDVAAWSVHRAAGTPGNLASVIAEYPEGTKITDRLFFEAMDRIRQREEEAQQTIEDMERIATNDSGESARQPVAPITEPMHGDAGEVTAPPRNRVSPFTRIHDHLSDSRESLEEAFRICGIAPVQGNTTVISEASELAELARRFLDLVQPRSPPSPPRPLPYDNSGDRRVFDLDDDFD